MRLRDLKNLGPASEEMLKRAGIETGAQLREIGAVRAFQRVKASGGNPSLNLLYALEGALTDTHWSELDPDVRGALLIAVDGLPHRHDL